MVEIEVMKKIQVSSPVPIVNQMCKNIANYLEPKNIRVTGYTIFD